MKRRFVRSHDRPHDGLTAQTEWPVDVPVYVYQAQYLVRLPGEVARSVASGFDRRRGVDFRQHHQCAEVRVRVREILQRFERLRFEKAIRVHEPRHDAQRKVRGRFDMSVHQDSSLQSGKPAQAFERVHNGAEVQLRSAPDYHGVRVPMPERVHSAASPVGVGHGAVQGFERLPAISSQSGRRRHHHGDRYVGFRNRCPMHRDRGGRFAHASSGREVDRIPVQLLVNADLNNSQWIERKDRLVGIRRVRHRIQGEISGPPQNLGKLSD